MEDRKKLDPHDEITEKEIKKKTLSIKNDNYESISNNKLNENDDSRINLTQNIVEKEDNNLVKDKTSDNNKNSKLSPKSKENIEENINIKKSNGEIIKEKILENKKILI